eukprot:1140334-Pelagomonas_calceolata.AAC.8
MGAQRKELPLKRCHSLSQYDTISDIHQEGDDTLGQSPIAGNDDLISSYGVGPQQLRASAAHQRALALHCTLYTILYIREAATWLKLQNFQ